MRILLPALLLAVAITAIGCLENDAPVLGPDGIPDDESQAAITLVPPRVDLVVLNFTSDVPSTTTACGVVRPNVSCAGGARSFWATVTIKNRATGTLPPGTLEVLWTDLNAGSSQIQQVSHSGIGPGASITATRPYYMGPCDCAPPTTFFTHSFNATVDPNNLIPEVRNNNNTSRAYHVCDGC